MDERLVVVGSGPAGVACAHALVSQGWDVTVLDAGLQLEPERQQIVGHLQRQKPSDWAPRELASLRAGANATAKGIPVKRVYGSDYTYREVHEHLPIAADGVTAFSSFATGGLSNVWGSAVLPYRAEDMDAWPVSAAELAPYYEAVFRFLPLAAAHDDLEKLFPLHSTQYGNLAPGRQAEMLLKRMERHRGGLQRRGFVWGRSRLAVRAAGDEQRHSCASCGLCMYGCPYDLIYSAAQTLAELQRRGKVIYRRDVVVEELRETADGVTLLAHDRRSRAPLTVEADRVFLGAGVFSSAHILLRSLGEPQARLTMRDSQYFLMPLLSLRGMPRVAEEGLHTLAQIFIEIFDSSFGPHPVHLQVYTYNDLYARAMKSVFGGLYPLLRLPANVLLSRLMVIQGYLHSDLSSSATLVLDNGTLRATRDANPEAARLVRATAKKLRRNVRRLGFVPLSPLLQIGDPGQGAHIGGTFPMRCAPGPWESDVMGRPHGLERVHIVDASVLPSIPSTTITLSVMANAYRIGSEWHSHDA